MRIESHRIRYGHGTRNSRISKEIKETNPPALNLTTIGVAKRASGTSKCCRGSPEGHQSWESHNQKELDCCNTSSSA
jgi:hypothetical protein